MNSEWQRQHETDNSTLLPTQKVPFRGVLGIDTHIRVYCEVLVEATVCCEVLVEATVCCEVLVETTVCGEVLVEATVCCEVLVEATVC